MSSKESKNKLSIVNELYDIFEIIVFAACFVLVIYSFIGRLCRVTGGSMDKTLADGQMVIASNIGYEPSCGDIVVFHQTAEVIGLNEPVVKRVIATGGQTVDIDFDSWTVTVTDTDGTVTVLDESKYRYLDSGYATRLSDFNYPLVVPEGHLFVLGDNRNNSTDSRSRWIGMVDERRLLGKVIFRITPFDKFGSID